MLNHFLTHILNSVFKYEITASEILNTTFIGIITKNGIEPLFLSDGREKVFQKLIADQKASSILETCPRKGDKCKSSKTFEEFRQSLIEAKEKRPKAIVKRVAILEVMDPLYAQKKNLKGMIGDLKVISQHDDDVYKGTFTPIVKVGFADRYILTAKVEVIEEPENEDNTVYRFLENECVMDSNAEITSKELYAHYKDYCQENEYQFIGKRKFPRRLKLIKKKITKYKRSNGSVCEYVYKGISVNRERKKAEKAKPESCNCFNCPSLTEKTFQNCFDCKKSLYVNKSLCNQCKHKNYCADIDIPF